MPPLQVAARSRGLYDVTFVAQEAIPHFVNVTFNEEDVPGETLEEFERVDFVEIRCVF